MKIANQLLNSDIARMAGVSEKAVESWLADQKSRSYRNMSDRHMRLIKFELVANGKTQPRSKGSNKAVLKAWISTHQSR